jgi:hypothetical protein
LEGFVIDIVGRCRRAANSNSRVAPNAILSGVFPENWFSTHDPT